MLEWLKDILGEGYTEDVDKKVSKKIGENFVARKDFNDTNEELKVAKATIAERDGQLEKLKNESGNVEDLVAKIAQLQADNEAAAATYEAEKKAIVRGGIDDALLLEARAKNLAATKALLTQIEDDVDDDQYREMRLEEIKNLKAAEDAAFLFATESTKQPVLKGVTPAEKKDGLPDSTTEPASLGDAIKLHFAKED